MCSKSQSLDDRRPQFLRQLVGNGPVFRRLAYQMRQGTVPNRVFLYGPSGAGKTTVARILARHFFCLRRTGAGDPCGTCEPCRRPLGEIVEFEQWTAARMEQNWGWWEAHGRSILHRPDWAFFLDEAQDLSPIHQKDLFDVLESAHALVIFATTHRNHIIDAIVNRFGANVLELRRPTPDEALASVQELCQRLSVVAADVALRHAIDHYQCDMRKCVDFVYAAREQAPEGIVSDDFLEIVFGDRPQTGNHAHSTEASEISEGLSVI